MEKVAVLALKVAKARGKSMLKQIYKTHENNQDKSAKLDAALMSSLSNALLDDMDKLDAKLDALCKAPMKTAQQYLNTGLNALFNAHHNTDIDENDTNKNHKICDEYFNLSYQKAQEGFHTVQDASDKIICGRIAMISAIFAFRNNIPLLLNEIRLRFLDILTDYNVQITLKSYHGITTSAGVTMKKLWTSKNKLHEYRQIVFDIVQLYHLLTTQLSSNLMIATSKSSHIENKKLKRIENHEQKQLHIELDHVHGHGDEDEKKQDNNNKYANMVKYQRKSPFSSGAWLLLGVPKCIQHNTANVNISIGCISQTKLSMSTTQSLQTIQSIIQHCLTKFVLFSGYNMSYKQYDAFVADYCHEFGGKKQGKYKKDMYDNNLIFNLKLIASRGIKDQPNVILVGNRPLIIHCVGLKHWNLAMFLCKYYPLNILQFNTHNRWTPLIYALIDNEIKLIRLICDIWDNQLKYEMDSISHKLQQDFVGNKFDLLNHCENEGNPTLLFCHSIEAIDILCNGYSVDINCFFKKRNQTLLICCVHRCLYEVVDYILNTYDEIIDVNIQNVSGNTAMMNTFRKLRNGNVKMINIFLKWNKKHRKIDWKLRNKNKKNVFDLLKDAKSLINNDKVYQSILDEITKQSMLSLA